MPSRATGESARTNPPRRRLQAVGLAVFAVLLVSALTVAFTNASGARLIAVNSELLQWSNVTSGASAITRAALNQAIVFTIDEELGVSSSEASRIAIDEADLTSAGLRALATDAPADLEGVAAQVEALADEADAVVASLRASDAVDAISILRDEFEPMSATVAATLAGAQSVYASEIDAAESTATRIEGALQWMATLLIPGIAILLYRIILRRKFERSKVEFEARLGAERELNVAKDEIIAGISHELRTPLTSILGFSQHLIEHGLEDSEEALELLAVINHDSQELARMVEDLLTAARLESQGLTYDMEVVDLVAEARSIAGHLRRTDIVARAVGDPAPVWADAVRTRQIIRNLLSNAIQHGGPKVSIRIHSGQGVTACEVIDNGTGVPAAIADRLFERFVHEGPSSLLTGSVGLDLAIARSLATAMGGTVTHERASGLTIFTLELPTSPAGVAIDSLNGADKARRNGHDVPARMPGVGVNHPAPPGPIVPAR